MKQLRPAYLIIANTAILLWALQFAAYAGLRAYYAVSPAPAPDEMSDAVKRNYSHMTADERTDLRHATDRLRFRLEPNIGMLHERIVSRFVNVDAAGIRANGPNPRPITALEGTIWFLGGSTAFGDGIADHETIPAQLERIAGRPVINLGVPAYSSPLENVLFVHYLRAGYRPSLALFLDGINEACEPDLYDDEMRELYRRAQLPYYWDVGGPLGAAVTRTIRKVKRAAGVGETGTPQAIACARDGKEYPLAQLHSRIMAERTALCRLYEVDCHTLVQPFAGTHGPAADLPRWFLEGDAKTLSTLFYHLEPSWQAADATFITDALDSYPRHPFIDEMHYSADASRVIAEVIARRVKLH